MRTEEKRVINLSEHRDMVLRADNWTNLFSGMGVKGRDPKQHTKYCQGNVISHAELNDLYRFGGVSRRIVELKAKMMLREGFEIDIDADGDLTDYLGRFSFMAKLEEILVKARLYGGCIGFLGIKDGGLPDEPVNENRIKSIDFMHVFDRTIVDIYSTDFYKDPLSEKFGEPEFYTVFSRRSGNLFRVHESRIIRLNGVMLPEDDFIQNGYWHDSVLQPIYEDLRRTGTTLSSVETILDTFSQSTLSVKGLATLIASNPKAVRDRLNIMDMSKNILNTILLDVDESYDVKSNSVAGVAEILRELKNHLSSVTGYPVTLLFGTSPGGLNTTGESDTTNFYDDVKAEQESVLSPALKKVIGYALKAANSPFKSQTEDYEIKFNPLWQMSEKEQAELYKTTAEADAAYIDRGVLDPDEVATGRFTEDGFNSGGIQLDPDVVRGSRDPSEFDEPGDGDDFSDI